MIQEHGFTQARGYGDIEYFAPFIEFVNDGPVDFCVIIKNDAFDFTELCDNVNSIIDQHMNPNGLIYLSLNKYLVKPRCYSPELSDDYDLAIEQFVGKNIKATIRTYKPCGLDHGNMFNWIHPLTRFLLEIR